MNDVQIVILHPEKWRAYKQLRLKALREEPAAFSTTYTSQLSVPDHEWKERLTRYQKRKGNWMLFAQKNNKLIGMMGAYQTEKDISNNSAHIMAVFVAKPYRGKGISKLLLAKLLTELKKAKIRVVELGVNCKQKAACALYAHFGFVMFEKKRLMLGDGKRHTEYLMRLILQK